MPESREAVGGSQVDAGPLELIDRVTDCRIWRVTHDPAVIHMHRYFNVPAFSPDGRWLAIVRSLHQGWRSEAFELHDLQNGSITELKDAYGCPVWNAARNEFYWLCDKQLWALNCDTGRRRVLYEWTEPQDIFAPWSVDQAGRWLIGSNTLDVEQEVNAHIQKLDLAQPGSPITLYEAPEAGCFFFLVRVNPAHDIACFRYHTPRGHAQPGGNHFAMIDINSGHYYPAEYPQEWGHRSWNGDGQWYVRANMERFVVKPWDHCRDEDPWLYLSPFYSTNHQGPCGDSGRFMIGDYSDDILHLLDIFTSRVYDIACAPSYSVPYSKHADPHPIGSPDGTKIVFDCCYDLERAPITMLTRGMDTEDMIVEVKSTAGFPAQGKILIGDYGGEYLTYDRCDEHRFFISKRSIAPDLPAAPVEYGEPARTTSGCFAEKTILTSHAGRHLSDGRVREPDVFIAQVKHPALPRDLRAETTTAGIRLLWQAPPDAREINEYHVYRRLPGQMTPQCVATTDMFEYLVPAPPTEQCAYSIASVERFGITSDRSAEVVVMPAQASCHPGMSWLIPAESRVPVMGCWDELELDAYNSRVVCGDNGGTSRFLLRTDVAQNVHVWIRSRSVAESHAVAISCGKSKGHETLIKGGPWHWTRLNLPEPLALAAGDNELKIHYMSKYSNELKIDLLSIVPENVDPFLPLNDLETD